MAPPEQGVAYGVSVPPGQSGRVNIWMDNQTDQTQSYLMCCRLTFLSGFDVYDSSGHRILNKQEESETKMCAAHQDFAMSCTCSAWISVPAHTMEVVDAGELSDGYTLSQGEYFLLPAHKNTSDCDAVSKLPSGQTLSGLGHAIRLVVPQP